MKRTIFLLTAMLCSSLWAEVTQTFNAKLVRTDRKAFRVVLEDCDEVQLTYKLENGRESKILPVAEVDNVQIQLPKLSLDELQARLVAAEYGDVVSVLEPVVGNAGKYMIVPNNIVPVFALLTKAYLRNGDIAKARSAAEQLQVVSDPEIKREAQSIIAECIVESGDLEEAKKRVAKLEDSAARLYLTARIQRDEKQSKEAMQTIVELIASHPNDHNWMPQAEYLCAQLYLDLGMPDSAAEVARQTVTLYPGSEFKIEAQKLQEEINQKTEASGQAE